MAYSSSRSVVINRYPPSDMRRLVCLLILFCCNLTYVELSYAESTVEPKRLAPNIGAIMAPKMLVERKLKVAFMYRERPDNKIDSGWRVFSGKEPEGYTDDPNNVAVYDADTIAKIDPDIIPLLSRSANCAFERKNGEGAFEEVHNFEFPKNGE